MELIFELINTVISSAFESIIVFIQLKIKEKNEKMGSLSLPLTLAGIGTGIDILIGMIKWPAICIWYATKSLN